MKTNQQDPWFEAGLKRNNETPQQWLDAQREVIVIRETVIEKIKGISKNPKMTDALIAWIKAQPCEPMNSICGLRMITDPAQMRSEINLIASAWITAGKPGLEVLPCDQP